MISVRTTLILGAGASIPSGYPSAEALNIAIRTGLEDPRSSLCQQLLGLGHSGAHLKDFLNRLIIAEYDSIDEFLRNVPDYETVGKQAITHILLEKEVEDHTERSRRSGHWYNLLKSALLDETNLRSIIPSMLNIITFNYDRSLENYLHRTLTAGTAHPEGDVVNVLNSIAIHHAHGILGHLPWQQARYRRAYGEPVTPDAVVNSANSLRLSHNWDFRTLDSRAMALIDNSERVFFLGFAFANSNMLKLGLKSNSHGDKKIFGTRYEYPSAKLDDQIADFPILAGLKNMSENTDIAGLITKHETLGRKVVRAHA